MLRCISLFWARKEARRVAEHRPGDSSRKRPYVSRISENSSVLRHSARRTIDTALRDPEHRLQTSVASDRGAPSARKNSSEHVRAAVGHCRAPCVMLAVATNPAPIKTVRWASRCEALCVDTGAKITEELCDSLQDQDRSDAAAPRSEGLGASAGGHEPVRTRTSSRRARGGAR